MKDRTKTGKIKRGRSKQRSFEKKKDREEGRKEGKKKVKEEKTRKANNTASSLRSTHHAQTFPTEELLLKGAADHPSSKIRMSCQATGDGMDPHPAPPCPALPRPKENTTPTLSGPHKSSPTPSTLHLQTVTLVNSLVEGKVMLLGPSRGEVIPRSGPHLVPPLRRPLHAAPSRLFTVFH